MATPLRLKRRAAGGAPGAPAALLSAEPAFNEQDKVLYYGLGDNGSGNATSVIPIGGSGAFVDKGTDQTIGGAKTFSSPVAVPAPTDGSHAVNKTTLDNAVANAGGGDMLKSVYDPNNDGKVNSAAAADTVPWTGVSGKPGTFPPDAHNQDASTINSGVLDAARIPSLDASKLGSGTIDIARLPVLPSMQQIISSGGIAALDAGQQALIGDGSVVTTTDGRRWIYTGSGSKTAEASYIEMADITPDWSVITNKPSFATVATSGSYSDLSNKPTLGSMAAQNAGAVAITGGTIDGVTFDGGTF